ncbi:glycoside hydrolase family 2 protein [Alkalihalobacillus sp. LMS39]|uniref:beta-mannosidase n=1 Tax=Alkalihalobacillus sp. LMS39 TaxID=2924032 RepID=UPI001FB21A47|nr:glycoside hydrolase family 2 protein [Alkalihalobacillus sp. LMS39]UOE93553.1 glycoside hydrolase family 2 protein [Alkalihalobacillus sp. LMS39]
MLTIDLNGKWKMKQADSDEWLEAIVPGSVFSVLLKHGKMEDPFYRDNEKFVYELAKKDYEYIRKFDINESFLLQDKITLCCEGLDTLARVSINGNVVATTNNMHRTYELDVKKYLQVGVNEIHIYFTSPVQYIKEKQSESYLWGVPDAIDGFPHLRKAHYMFGWDWGPKVPDSGIWRSISLRGYETGKIEDVYMTQHHSPGQVTLQTKIKIIMFRPSTVTVNVQIIDPNGGVISNDTAPIEQVEQLETIINAPKLWWPNGYGEQPLYKVIIGLYENEKKIDAKSYTVGLRTIKVKQELDQWGRTFEFEVNGISIFSMGANYIPEDNLISRGSKGQTEKLIKNCVDANFNTIRVWGGGYYPNDDFYTLCDEYGLIVWQDFMFACAVYELTDAFTETIIAEVEDNVKRIRHHACLGIWCGNNEMEEAWVGWDFPKPPKLRMDYIKQFEMIFPDLMKKLDPQTFYWASSPSSGGGFVKPNSQNEGDVHYWDVWHGLKPFTEYRKFHFRFCSEFGFQSFPSLKTVKSFTEPVDRNIFSPVMENHQKNGAANGKILFYLSENFLYPKDFSSLLYASQILQAEAIKYGVEHWRRHRGRCMGSIYWQLNDCWPVASWSSIDYNGRWKALHYFAKKFYAPVLLSVLDEENTMSFYVTNDRTEEVVCTIEWSLRRNDSTIIQQGTVVATVPPLFAKPCESMTFHQLFSEEMKQKHYLDYKLIYEGKVQGHSTILFTKAKHFQFLNPKMKVDITETEQSFVITLKTEAFAKYIELDLHEADCIFSDNYFDLSAGETKEIVVLKEKMNQVMDLDLFKKQFKTRSIYDIATME